MALKSPIGTGAHAGIVFGRIAKTKNVIIPIDTQKKIFSKTAVERRKQSKIGKHEIKTAVDALNKSKEFQEAGKKTTVSEYEKFIREDIAKQKKIENRELAKEKKIADRKAAQAERIEKKKAAREAVKAKTAAAKTPKKPAPKTLVSGLLGLDSNKKPEKADKNRDNDLLKPGYSVDKKRKAREDFYKEFSQPQTPSTVGPKIQKANKLPRTGWQQEVNKSASNAHDINI